jgi:hypothetical protein
VSAATYSHRGKVVMFLNGVMIMHREVAVWYLRNKERFETLLSTCSDKAGGQ